MEIKASQIAQLLNELYDGVERSKCGKIVRYESESGQAYIDPSTGKSCFGIMQSRPF